MRLEVNKKDYISVYIFPNMCLLGDLQGCNALLSLYSVCRTCRRL